MKKLAAILVLAAFVVTGCNDSKAGKQNKAEAKQTAGVVDRLRKQVGFPHPTDSQELRNLKRRYEQLDDPNATGYVYLISHGLIFGEYTVKGKVSSLNSQFTNDDQIVDNCDGSCGGVTIRQAEPDGSYGDNPEGIFFWDTDGVYHEWRGDYEYTTQRLEIQQPQQNIVTKQAK